MHSVRLTCNRRRPSVSTNWVTRGPKHVRNVKLRFVPEFARFENLDEVEALDLPGSTNAGLNEFNQEFATYTIKSKMDESNEDIFSKDNNDEDPF